MERYSIIIIIFLLFASILHLNLGIGDADVVAFAEDFYKPHSPIRIESNEDFNLAHGVVYGSGTEDDPYIISGWKIDANHTQYGILISNVSAYVVIENCYISNTFHSTGKSVGQGYWDFFDDAGIKISNASNVRIENVTLDYCNSGIIIEYSYNIFISDSHFTSVIWDGIYANSSRWIYINSNVFTFPSGGILLRHVYFSKIQKNRFIKVSGENIAVYNTGHIYVANNTFLEGNRISMGIDAESSNNNTFENNTIKNYGTGIFVKSSYSMRILNNTLENCSVKIGGSFAQVLSYIMEGNRVNGKDLIFIKNIENFSINSNNSTPGEMVLVNVSHFQIFGMKISHTSVAIQVLYGNNGTIENMTFRDNLKALLIENSRNITLRKNSISGGEDGIVLISCESSYISDNNCQYTRSSGIYISNCEHIKIENNSCYRCGYAIDVKCFSEDMRVVNNHCNENVNGIYLWFVYNSEIKRNVCSNNKDMGRLISGELVNSTITGNICNDNQWYGINVDGWVKDSTISNNVLRGNREGLKIEDSKALQNCTVIGNDISNRIENSVMYLILVLFTISIFAVLFIRWKKRR